jgi:hypothetical protein
MAGGNGQGRDDAFFADVLRGIGAPVNSATLSVLKAWSAFESGTMRNNPDSASWNPLNSTLPADGATSFNSIGVRNYASRDQGVRATIATLKSKSHYYDGVLSALRSSNAELAMREIVASPWSGTHYGAPKMRGGGWDYRSTNLYKTFKQYVGSDATTPTSAIIPDDSPSSIPKLPAGLTSGDGSAGNAVYDPTAKVLITYRVNPQPNQSPWQVWSPWSLWLSRTPAAERKRWRITVDPGAYQRLYDTLDPGAVTPTASPLGIPSPLDGFMGIPWADGGLFSWVGNNLSRIGLVLLAVLIIIIAFIYQNKGTIADTAKTVTKVGALI